MPKLFILIYGLLSYLLGSLVLVYAIGFLGGFLAPTQLDGPRTFPIVEAIVVDVALLLLFAVQHSVMARPWFKVQLTRLLPAAMERSTYVLLSSVVMLLLFWQWRPINWIIWNAEYPLLRVACYALYATGWLVIVLSTLQINHFDLFGLRQVWLAFTGKSYTHLPLTRPLFYRWVRHPLYVGWLLTFWATPTMGLGHLLFASITTLYILVAIVLEERDLLAHHGPAYAAYQKEVPMLVPGLRGR